MPSNHYVTEPLWPTTERAQTTEWLTAEVDRLTELTRSWNRAVSHFGACGSEFHDDPERSIAQVVRSAKFKAGLEIRKEMLASPLPPQPEAEGEK